MAAKAKAKVKGKRPKSVVTNVEKVLGGVTGKGFVPGQSGNPKGRPRKFLTLVSDALREKLKQVSEDENRTYAEVLADKLVEEARKSALPVTAIKEIIDRTEGKPKQQVDINDVTDKFSGRTKEELQYFAEHGKFPDVQG